MATAHSAQSPIGEFACDFYPYGCHEISENMAEWNRHYSSLESRRKHMRLVEDKINELKNRIDKLEKGNKTYEVIQESHENRIKTLERENEQFQHRVDRDLATIQAKLAEIDLLKQRIAQLESQRLRVCSVWTLSLDDLRLPAQDFTTGWHELLTEQHGYKFAVRVRLWQAANQDLQLYFSLRLRPTPHDVTLQWPFVGQIRLEVYLPDGFQHLPRPTTCVISTDALTADQMNALNRPGLFNQADEPDSIEVSHPSGLSANQLQSIPGNANFTLRFGLLQ